MPRKRRVIKSDCFYHVYNRGAHKEDVFRDDYDFLYFYMKIIILKEELKLDVLAHSCAYNHFHLFLKEPNLQTLEKINLRGPCKTVISAFLARLQNSYTEYYNKKYKHSGVIFEGVFKSKNISDKEYFEHLIYYINLNAIKHGLVKNISDWKYTSHHEYIKARKPEFNIINNSSFVGFDCYEMNFSDYKKRFKIVEKYMKDGLEF